MLATVKAFREASGQSATQGPDIEELTPREGISFQESLFGVGPSALLPPLQSLPLAQVEEEKEDGEDMESQARSEHSSEGELDLDLLIQIQEDARLWRRLFTLKGLDELLQAI